jgi:hypothetical protein
MNSRTKEATYPSVSSLDKLGINVQADSERLRTLLIPRFRILDNGKTSEHVSEDGADYLYAELDYYDYTRSRSGPVLASRLIASILATNRTELSYATQASQPVEITAHRGRGMVTIGTPEKAMPKGHSALAQNTTMQHLHPTALPNVTVPSGRFYTIEAALPTPEPFVVSIFHIDGPEALDMAEVEIDFKPGQESVEAPEGTVRVPHDFRERFA